MSMTAWAGITVGFAAADGNLKQLFPTTAPTGTAKATATPGQWVRQPCEGELMGLQVQTDGTNGGIVEIWDVNGEDGGADVSAAVITDAELQTAITNGKAKLLYSQNVVGSGVTPPNPGYFRFVRGLAARFVGAAGEVKLNLNVNGGFRLIGGSYRP
jgi:hypothetical protein